MLCDWKHVPEPSKKENSDVITTIPMYGQTLWMADSLLQNQVQRLRHHAGYQNHQTHLEVQRSRLHKTVPVAV